MLFVLSLIACVLGNPYVPTPAGWVLANCVHEVPAGTVLDKLPSGALSARYLDGSEHVIPLCDHGDLPVLHRNKASMPGAPEVYDGWTLYTEYDIASTAEATFDSFTGYMSTPDMPAAVPQVLYIFPGLQNIDWIPVVDPDPTQQFDIIQPVLQYPGDAGHYWSVKSWYVTLDVGTVHSAEVRLSPGDNVFGSMQRTGDTAWFIESLDTTTGKSTNISVNHPRLQYQPWAYNTIECYGCSGCNTYPKQPEHFTQLKLTSGGKTVTPTWKVDPKPSKMKQCGERAQIFDAATIDLVFQKS